MRKARMVRPSTIRLKYSAGPNFTAINANGGAATVSATTATVPAMNDPKAEMPSAGPARPCFAIWWPSSVVTIEAASPGILTRTAVVEPPYIAP